VKVEGMERDEGRGERRGRKRGALARGTKGRGSNVG